MKVKSIVQITASILTLSSSMVNAGTSRYSCNLKSEVPSAVRLSESLQEKGFTFDPDPEKWSQFESLHVDFSKIKLVGLGEASHGTSEFSTARHQLFRYLVERHGFRVFVIEDEWLGGLAVTEALQGKADLREALNKLTKKGTFLTEETIALFEWITEFNKTHTIDPITVYGADAQNWTTLIASLEHLAERLPNRATEANRLRDTISSFVETARKPDFLATATIDTFKGPLKEAREFEKIIVQDLKKKSDKNIRRLEGLAHFPAQFLQKVATEVIGMGSQDLIDAVFFDKDFIALFDEPCLQSAFTCRDHAMTSNIKLALEIERKRGVYWAHNGHVGRFLNHPDIVWSNPRSKQVNIVPNTGSMLDKLFGVSYFPVITDFYQGSFLARETNSINLKSWTVSSAVKEPDSLHQVLHGLGKANFVLNLRNGNDYAINEFLKKPQLIRLVGAEFSNSSNTVEESYMSAVLPKYADAYIYFDTSSPHVPL